MIHQGALILTEHAQKVKAEKISTGNFTDIIHLHLKKDAILEEHLAKTNAVLVVVEGEVDFKAHEKKYKLTKGDFLTFEANILHSLEAFEDSHLILIK
jgi:quercetin dioxygenase-like cupin family protein